ncbi:hypothetical protein L218DRAFT_523347 [Marasmius fiardii PR-910]|nr:hypothetical protein L218DRAFT_523347 [Marasmius fiardii PR-910]
MGNSEPPTSLAILPSPVSLLLAEVLTLVALTRIPSLLISLFFGPTTVSDAFHVYHPPGLFFVFSHPSRNICIAFPPVISKFSFQFLTLTCFDIFASINTPLFVVARFLPFHFPFSSITFLILLVSI